MHLTVDNYSQYSDLELVGLLSEGNAAAFKQIYHRYWDKLLYLAGKKLQDVQEAENVVQDIFLSMWDRRAELDVRSTLEGYLVVSVKYRVLNVLATQQRLKQYQEVTRGNNLENTTTESFAGIKEIQSLLALLTDKLPEKCRLAYKLRNEGFSHREIAGHMEISEKTVENHIGRALKELRLGLRQLISICFTL